MSRRLVSPAWTATAFFCGGRRRGAAIGNPSSIGDAVHGEDWRARRAALEEDFHFAQGIRLGEGEHLQPIDQHTGGLGTECR